MNYYNYNVTIGISENNTCGSSSGCQVLLVTLLFLLTFFFIICCFQLEPDTDRCGFLTVPEEWKIVDNIMQQAAENGTHENGTYMYMIKSNHVVICLLVVSFLFRN